MIWLDEWFTVSVCAAQLDREGNLIVPMRGCCELNWSWWTVVIELISRVMWTTSSFRLLPFRVNCSSDDGFGGDNNKVPSSSLLLSISSLSSLILFIDFYFRRPTTKLSTRVLLCRSSSSKIKGGAVVVLVVVGNQHLVIKSI
jgi:hypothetical protein